MKGTQTGSILQTEEDEIRTVLVNSAAYPAISSDGNWIAYADEDEKRVLVRAADGSEVLQEVTDPSWDAFRGVALSPDANYLSVLVGLESGDRGLQVYETDDGELVHEDTKTRWAYKGTAFSRDGETVTWGSGSGTVRIFETGTWEQVTSVSGGGLRTYDNEFSEEYFAHTNDDGVYIYEYPGFDQTEHFEDGDNEGISFTEDGEWLAYAKDDSTVVVRETDDWTVVETLEQSDNEVTDIQFVGTGDDRRLAYADPEDNVVYVHDAEDWTLLEEHTLEGATLPDRSLAMGSKTETLLVLWDSPATLTVLTDWAAVDETIELEATVDSVTAESYEWDFGDGTETTTDDGTTSQSYEDPGHYVVEVTVHGADGETFRDEKTIEVVDFGARFTVRPATPAPGPEIPLDASDSIGDIASYEWDLTDDGTTDATGEQTTYIFEDSGDYDITLTVTGVNGETDSTTETVTVSRELWEFETGASIYSSPTVVDSTLYVGSRDDYVYALDAVTGEEQWRFETGDEVYSSPSVVDGTVLVGSDDNYVYALDADADWTEGSHEEKEYRWRFDTGGRVQSSPTVYNGTVYIWPMTGDVSSRVYALDVDPDWTEGSYEDENEKWYVEIPNNDWPSLTVVENTIYAGSHDGHVYALDAVTGEELWRFETNQAVWSSPTVADGAVYVGSRDSYVYALDANPDWSVGSVENGDYRWRFETGDAVQASPTVSDGTVYVGSLDETLYALDVDPDWTEGSYDDTDEKWQYNARGWVYSSATVADSIVYVGTSDPFMTYLHAVDADTGLREWWHATDHIFPSSPTVADGAVYVGSWDDKIHALGVGSHTSSDDSRVNLGTFGHHDTWAERASAAGTFAVEVIETNAPVDPGETLELTVAVENTGESDGTKELGVDAGALGSDWQWLELTAEESAERDLSFETDSDDEGVHAVDIQTPDDEERVVVTVGDVDELTVTATGDSIDEPGSEWRLALSGTNVDELVIEQLWTDWGVSVETDGGGVPVDDVGQDGTYTLTWDETQYAVAVELTVSPPERYVGGEYLVSVTATGPDETAETTATLEIA